MDKLKADIESLWEICFHDDSNFMQLFFGNVYKAENVYVKYDGNKLVSALQSLPYNFSFYDNILPIRYYAGVSTSPGYRNRGYMGELLKSAIRNCTDSLVCLLPAEDWLYQYYHKFGFSDVFYNKMEIISSFCNNSELKSNDVVESDMVALYNYFRTEEVKQNCTILHDKFSDFKAIIEDNRLSGGKIITVADGGSICGIAFCYPEDGIIVIKKFLFEEGYKQNLIDKISYNYPNKKLGFVSRGNENRFGMMRITNPKKILEIFSWKYSDIEISFRINDDIIDSNNCILKGKKGCIQIEKCGHFDYNIGIDELSDFIFGKRTFYGISGESPYMSLMLE